jgi:hypothetical protein
MRKAMILCGVSLLAIGAGGAWWRGERRVVQTTAALPPVHVTVRAQPARTPLAAPGKTPVDDPPVRAPGEKALTSVEWTRQLRDEMCACADAACVREVDLRYRNLPAKFSPEDSDVVRRTIQDSARCEQRVLDGRPTSG